GYEWARKLGHRVTALAPALVPMETDTGVFHRAQGIRLEADVTGKVGPKRLRSFRGDLLFTAYGLSGPTVLAASADLAPRLGAGHAALELNFFPGMGVEEVDGILAERWALDPAR